MSCLKNLATQKGVFTTRNPRQPWQEKSTLKSQMVPEHFGSMTWKRMTPMCSFYGIPTQAYWFKKGGHIQGTGAIRAFKHSTYREIHSPIWEYFEGSGFNDPSRLKNKKNTMQGHVHPYVGQQAERPHLDLFQSAIHKYHDRHQNRLTIRLLEKIQRP